MEYKVYEEDKPYKNDESPIPLKRYKISYFAFDIDGKIIRAYKILYAHDQEDVKRKSGVHTNLIYKIEQLK